MSKDRITSLNELHQAAMDRKSVYCPSSYSFGERKPAAFMINQSGAVLRRLFEQGMYIYKPTGGGPWKKGEGEKYT